MTTIPESLASALVGRYAIQHELGRGGMATVYVARDIKHNRSVAIKVLRADLAATLGPDRFLKEIEIAAQLNHPHILTLIDSGEAAGFLYYVMPLIQGSSLRRRLEHDGRLDLAEALAITREVAEALSYAHRKGVVHRDIKPENILFSEGHAMVADFGIARAVGSAGVRHLTRTGVPLGTPGYMSPEQAIGRTDVGPAADVYGLACVTYEMVIGEPPDMWPSDEALRLERFIDAQEKHRDRLEALPSEVERALVRALALRPDQRFSTPVEFADALQRPMGVRRYSRKEVDQMVGHAADLQASNPTQADALTLGTVQQIAADVGIPPQHVRSAARALEPQPRPAARPSKFLGGPTTLDFEYTLEGEVPESEYLTLVEDIRTTLGVVGNVSTLGTSMTWNSAGMGNPSRDVTVAITSRGGGTRLRVTERLKNLTGALFGGIMGGVGGGGMGLAMGIGIGVFDSPAAAVLLVLTNVGLSYVLARTFFRSTSRKRFSELQRLADRLAGYINDVNRPALPKEYRPGQTMTLEVSLETPDSAPVHLRHEGPLAFLTLNRPSRLNAVSLPLYNALAEILQALGNDSAVRAVLITGAGRAFCVGADLKAHGEAEPTREERRRYAEAGQRVYRALQTLPKPVVAAVNGHAIGAGLELALSCDIIVVADEAKLRFPELALGTFVGGGLTYTLMQRVGVCRAKELVFLAEFFDGKEAARIGLVNRCVPTVEVLVSATTLAQRLAAMAPLPLALAKRLFDQAWHLDAEAALKRETEALLQCMETSDWREGIEAFHERREPRFTGS